MMTSKKTQAGKVGVLRFSALGDVALALPFLRALKVKPVILTMPAGHALLSDEFDAFVVLRSKCLPDLLRFVRDVRRARLDVLIDLQSNDRSRFLARCSGVKQRFERTFEPHVFSAVDAWQRILAPSGLLGPLDFSFEPKSRTYIVLNMGSSPAWLSKRLPAHTWREISVLLHERFGLPFVLTGSAEERSYIDSVARGLVGTIDNRAGRTSLQQLKRLLADAWLTISTDSAAMHIAAAMKTPVIGIFGATNWERAAPMGPWTRVVYDRIFYADGRPPAVNLPDPLPCYAHIDISPALDELAPYLSPQPNQGG